MLRLIIHHFNITECCATDDQLANKLDIQVGQKIIPNIHYINSQQLSVKPIKSKNNTIYHCKLLSSLNITTLDAPQS
jgi:hypothetical protein